MPVGAWGCYSDYNPRENARLRAWTAHYLAKAAAAGRPKPAARKKTRGTWPPGRA